MGQPAVFLLPLGGRAKLLKNRLRHVPELQLTEKLFAESLF